MYEPKVTDTSEIVLPAELIDLRERIAQEVHDTWALQKIKDGWIWGNQTSKEFKTHTDLIPYEDLSEEMKRYDRATAEATLRLIVKLGFEIVAPRER